MLTTSDSDACAVGVAGDDGTVEAAVESYAGLSAAVSVGSVDTESVVARDALPSSNEGDFGFLNECPDRLDGARTDDDCSPLACDPLFDEVVELVEPAALDDGSEGDDPLEFPMTTSGAVDAVLAVEPPVVSVLEVLEVPDVPDVSVDAVVDDASLCEGEEPPDSSASATVGVLPSAKPTPSATASAPTRPMYLALPMAVAFPRTTAGAPHLSVRPTLRLSPDRI